MRGEGGVGSAKESGVAAGPIPADIAMDQREAEV